METLPMASQTGLVPFCPARSSALCFNSPLSPIMHDRWPWQHFYWLTVVSFIGHDLTCLVGRQAYLWWLEIKVTIRSLNRAITVFYHSKSIKIWFLGHSSHVQVLSSHPEWRALKRRPFHHRLFHWAGLIWRPHCFLSQPQGAGCLDCSIFIKFLQLRVYETEIQNRGSNSVSILVTVLGSNSLSRCSPHLFTSPSVSFWDC